jgi:hypothetical protein
VVRRQLPAARGRGDRLVARAAVPRGHHPHRPHRRPSHPLGPGTTQPWEHLHPKEVRDRIADANAAIVAATTPKRCTTGKGCAGCGVATAVQWTLTDLADGPALQLCDLCLPLWVTYGPSTPDSSGWVQALTADLLGVRVDMALGYGLQPFHIAVEDGHADPGGYEERFAYLDPDVVDACRQNWWRRHPTEAPRDWQERQARIAAAVALVGASAAPSPPPPTLRAPGTRREAKP